MEAFGVDEGFLLLQQGGLGGSLKLRQFGLQGLHFFILRPPARLGVGQRGLQGGVFFVEGVHGFAEVFELDMLLVALHFGFVGEGKLLLAFLQIGGLLFKAVDLGLVVLFLLLEFVDGDFGEAVAAVGFQQGKLRLFQTALLGLAFGSGVLVVLFEFGHGLGEGGDVV